MRLGSLFSGIGGIDLGFERAGFEIAWQVEIDSAARSVLSKHWPDVPKFEDVRQVGKSNLPRVDVIAGGFPCQDLSVAGKRNGIIGERSGLYFEMVRIIHELRPSFFVWENVPGLLSSYTAVNPPPADPPCMGAGFESAGRWLLEERSCFEAVLAALHRIGFSGCWRSLDAQFFGVPQRRERVFGVFARGRSGAERCAEILSLADGMCRNTSPRRQAGQSVAVALRSRSASRGVSAPGRGGEDDKNIVIAPTVRASGVGTERAGDTRGQDCLIVGSVSAKWSKGSGGPAGGECYNLVAHTLTAHEGLHDNCGQNFIAHTLSSEGADASEDGTGKGTQLCIAFKESQSGTRTGDIHATLDSNKGSRRQEGVMLPQGVRRLTPRECERLQGLPDDWTRWLADGREQKDGPRYKQIGNGVAVPVLEWIASRIPEAV